MLAQDFLFGNITKK